MIDRLSETITAIMADGFRRSDQAHRPWMNTIWIFVLYLTGMALWGEFFQWGDFPMTFHDWAQVTAPRLYFLKDAVVRGILPLHISSSYALGGVTDRYLSIPDAFISPQALLLAFLPVTSF